jgi:hypothetical protein
MAKAIAQNESNTNYNEKGKSGEYGAYQWMPGTWAADSQKYLGQAVPLEQATPQQQNQVAYRKIAAWKAAGYGPAQIASMWNAGGGNPDAYKGTFANGKPSDSSAPGGSPNAEGVNYNTPAYAKKVTDTYQQLIAQSTGNNPLSPLTPPPTTPLTVTDPNANTPPNQANPGLIAANVMGDTLGGTEGTAAATAARAIQATPNVAKGEWEGLTSPNFWQDLGGALGQAAQLHFKNAGADLNKQNINAPDVGKAQQIMASPIMGQKTVEGQSIPENLEAAGGGILQALGLQYASPLNEGINKLSKSVLPEIAQKFIPQGLIGKLLEAGVADKTGALQKLAKVLDH